MSNVPVLRFYKDENLTNAQLEKLNEILNLFQSDNPKWISRTECLNLKSCENMIFVFAVFEGSAFEHLRTNKARIISSHCMLMSLKMQRKLPRSLTPIYSLSMTDMNVCCTNIEKKLRQEIYDKVEMMQGKTCRIFTESVTHLVTTEVGSAKYHAAAGMRIPIMLPEWILDLWQKAETEETLHGSNPEYITKYKCPIFYKYVICASGFDETTKNEIKSLVESGGGTYSGSLVFGTTTHLISKEAKGAKYDHAKSWRICVVKPEWVYESIKTGYCLNEKNYQLETTNQTSTPTDNRVLKTRTAPDIDVSVINNNRNSTKLVNETDANYRTLSNTILNSSAANVTTTTTPTITTNSNSKINANKPLTNYSDLMKELNSIGKIKLTLFDGIGIYCENFDAQITEKLKKICNSGGAIRFDEYNSDVTHVVVNQVNEAKCKSYNELNPEVNIVTIDWLIDSCKKNELEDCKEYVVFKNTLNSVKTPKKRPRPEKPNTNTTKSLGDSDLNDCLSQYLTVEAAVMKQKQQANLMPPPTTTSISGFHAKLESKQPKLNEPEARNNTNSNPPSINSDSKPKSNGNKLFSNKRFQIFGFADVETQELEKVLQDNDATVIPFDANCSFSSYRNKDIIDYTLLPMTIPAPTSNNNPSTVYWMKKCIEKNKIIDLSEDVFYQPIPKYNEEKPLIKCVITISGFGTSEKDNISNLCLLLGAKVQQQLCFKDTNNILGNTHLICNKPAGPKYVAAKSWNLPVIGYEWVVDSCVTGIKADESKYSIENQTNTKELIEALAKIRQNDETLNSTSNNITNRSLAKASSYFPNTSLNVSSRKDETTKTGSNHDESGLIDEPNFNDSSLSYPNETKKRRIDTNDYDDNRSTSVANNKNNQTNQTINNETKEEDEDDEEEDENNDSDVVEKNNEPVLAAIENSAKLANNANRMSTNFHTTPCNPRLKELRQTEQLVTPLNQPNASNENNYVMKTPVWMKPGDQSNFKFNLDTKDLENFKTPTLISNKNLKSKVMPETPLDEVFAKAIHIAGMNSKNPAFYQNAHFSPGFEYSFEKSPNSKFRSDSKTADADQMKLQSKLDQHPSSQYAENGMLKKTKQILKNVKVCLSKKLVKKQNEIYPIVEDLGAEFLWTYNESCTHFIHNGKLNDSSKDLKLAREQNKIIVSPNWIYACKEQQTRLDESLYALTVNTAKLSTKSPFVSRNQSSQIQSLEFVESKAASKNDSIRIESESDNLNEPDVSDDLPKPCEEAQAKAADPEPEPEVKQDPPGPHIIPDSMDIKVMLIDQLQDKLASIRNSASVLPNKKWTKNNSGNFSSNNENDLDATSNETRKSDGNIINNQVNNQEETMINEQQALNELNSSRSKWGINTGAGTDSNVDKRKRTKSFTDNNSNEKHVEIHASNDDSEINLLNSFMGKQTDEAKKLMSNLKRKESTDGDAKMKQSILLEDEPKSPSLVDSKQKKFNFQEPPPASQIQMTIWKEDQNNIPSTNTTNRRKTANANKTNEREAMAERFIHASRASINKKITE